MQEPDNYHDCILQNMKNVSSDMAARAIAEACYDKYGDPELLKSNKKPAETGSTN
ncbi:hypothetical protein SAMN05216428_11416 [Nitrosospira sp. Nsp11]|nr:hypothetical protein SAMN05216428_11416 [Nitrosospira sp. Nsp11]